MAGRYKILDQLGVGGLGAVYKAYDTQLNRYVAIKRLLSKEEAEKGDDQAATLRKEAASLSSLQHPNIVSIFDLANDDEGFFIVMELLEGETLGDWLRRGVLEFHEFYDMASQSLEAILTAHHQSILHRDLKPENIKMLRLPGGRLQVKILDFGLARQSYGARKMTEDQSGNIMGSIYYMSPEQLRRKPIDGRTDLYALGCLFYQLISGRRPFDGATVQEIMDRHLNHQVYSLHEIAPNIPGPICDWIMWLINLDPGHRPANAQQALNSLKEIHEAGWFKAAAPVEEAPLPVVIEEPVRPARPIRPTGPNPPRKTGPSAPRPSSTSIPMAAAPAGFVRTATGALVPVGGNPVKAKPALPVVEPPPKKKIPIWAWAAAGVALIGVAIMLWPGGEEPGKATTANASARQASQPAADPAKRPQDLVLPNSILHYVGGQRMDPYINGVEVKSGESIKAWHDQSSAGGDAPMIIFEARRENCPTFLQAKIQDFRAPVSLLRFAEGQGMMNRPVPGSGNLYPLTPAVGKRGITMFVLVRPNLTIKEQSCVVMADTERKNALTMRTTKNNEVKVFTTIASVRKEFRVAGRDTSKFNLISVVWDIGTSKVMLTARTQDGGKGKVEGETGREIGSTTLTQCLISRGAAEKAPAESHFTGDIAEIIVWPFAMSVEDRNKQEWKLSQYYFTDPGTSY